MSSPLFYRVNTLSIYSDTDLETLQLALSIAKQSLEARKEEFHGTLNCLEEWSKRAAAALMERSILPEMEGDAEGCPVIPLYQNEES